MKYIFVFLLLVGFSAVAQNDPALDAAKKKMDNKDYAGAKTDLSKLIDTNPKNKKALTMRGRVRMALNDYYGAIGDFNSVLEVDSTQN